MMKAANRLDTVQEYYFSKKLREVRALSTQGKPIINMGIGSPDLQPPNEVIEAIQKAVTKYGAHKYQSYQGLPEFRKAWEVNKIDFIKGTLMMLKKNKNKNKHCFIRNFFV